MNAELDRLIIDALGRQADEYILDDTLRAAVNHLLGKGKLYRPKLALATIAALTGESGPGFVPFVTPLEIVHTFTLIHDDLPCMDDAALRRGVPAVHVAFDETLAVLAGDALCAMAFQIIAKAPPWDDPALGLRLVIALSYATQAVVAGQVEDIRVEGRPVTVSEVVAMQRRKTGALLGACCEFGATLVRAEPGRVTALRDIGFQLGVLFQLRDDLLSIESTEDQTGKSLHTDAVLGKGTLVALLGAAEAKDYAAQIERGIKAEIDKLSLRAPEHLLAAVRLAYHREH